MREKKVYKWLRFFINSNYSLILVSIGKIIGSFDPIIFIVEQSSDFYGKSRNCFSLDAWLLLKKKYDFDQ